MYRGDWQATIHEVAKGRTQLSYCCLWGFPGASDGKESASCGRF